MDSLASVVSVVIRDQASVVGQATVVNRVFLVSLGKVDFPAFLDTQEFLDGLEKVVNQDSVVTLEAGSAVGLDSAVTLVKVGRVALVATRA